MKLSVSLPDEDVEFLDYYVTMHDLKTRSAALQQALRALRDIDLGDQYQAAWQEVLDEDKQDLAAWVGELEAAAIERQRHTEGSPQQPLSHAAG